MFEEERKILNKRRNLIRDFIKLEIENNEYYENIYGEYSSKNEDKKQNIINLLYYCWKDDYDSYYSIYTILDSIEDTMNIADEKMSIEDTLNGVEFEIKDRF